jgi:hypothetical protein
MRCATSALELRAALGHIGRQGSFRTTGPGERMSSPWLLTPAPRGRRVEAGRLGDQKRIRRFGTASRVQRPGSCATPLARRPRDCRSQRHQHSIRARLRPLGRHNVHLAREFPRCANQRRGRRSRSGGRPPATEARRRLAHHAHTHFRSGHASVPNLWPLPGADRTASVADRRRHGRLQGAAGAGPRRRARERDDCDRRDAARSTSFRALATAQGSFRNTGPAECFVSRRALEGETPGAVSFRSEGASVGSSPELGAFG